MPEIGSGTGAGAPALAGNDSPKLNDLMLAMDVVDTLRHEEGMVVAELGQDERDKALKARLRQIYESQGLEVSDRILDEGIQGLKESRFVYTPPPPSFGRTMAELWVKRGGIGKSAGIFLAVIVAIAGWQLWNRQSARQQTEQARIEITSVLPKKLSDAIDAARREAKVPAAREAIDRLASEGRSSLASGDAKATNEVVAKLTDLRARLDQQYTLRIVSRPGERAGVFRIPAVNRGTRNYYLIVEALTTEGKLLSLPITNEEDGKVQSVTQWGVRVPQSTYEQVRKDKLDDGIIEHNRLGEKRRGALDPEYLMPVEGGTITKW